MRKILLSVLTALACASVAWGYTYIINDQDPPPNGTGLPLKWAPGTIAMRIYADNSTVLLDGSTAAGSIAASLDSWNALLGDGKFTYTINPGGSPADGDRINQISFSNSVYGQSFASGVLAVTTAWSRGNQRTEGDTIFNTAFTWNSYRDTRGNHANIGLPYDIQRVAIHETGHTLGLDHPDEANPVQNVSAIMNSHISNIAAQTADDIAGAQNLYGPNPFGSAQANDNFSNAFTITLTNNAATVTGFNNNATKESGEPNHAGDFGGRSVWWKWTAPANGPVNLDTNGSVFDTLLAVYTGSSVSALTAIASNDDVNPGVIQHSALTFTAASGTTYYFAVDGFYDTSGPGADRGAITLNLAFSPTSSGAHSAADFNGDSKSDLLWSNSTNGDRYVWLMNGTALGSSAFLGNVGTNWTVTTGDFNGDGKADLLWSNTANGDRYVWLMNGTALISSAYIGNVPTVWTVATGDFNGDGKADLLWSNTSTGDRYVWLMNGTAFSSSVFIGTVAPVWTVATGDFNADGKADLLWSNTATGDRYVWLMNGTALSSSVFIGTVAPVWTVATGDFNADGKSDLIWSNTSTGDRYVWLMNGTTLASSVFLATVGPQWLIGD